jgi:hypothetical protein
MNKLLIHALIFIGTAIGGGLIALGRYGDEKAAKEASNGEREFVVTYRNGNDGEFTTHGENTADPAAGHKTFKEAEHVARLLMASATCQVKIINVRTGREVAF